MILLKFGLQFEKSLHLDEKCLVPVILWWEFFCATYKAQIIDEIGKTTVDQEPSGGGGEGGDEIKEICGSRQENAQGRRRALPEITEFK